MMKKLWPLLLIIPLQSIHPQEVKHAPTIEQCRADLRVRMPRVLSARNGGADDAIFVELTNWHHELYACRTVDLSLTNQYANVGGAIAEEQKRRLLDFIKRHNLVEEFLAEDAQGER